MHIPRAGALFFRSCGRCALLISLCLTAHVASARQTQGGDPRDEVRARLLAVGESPKDAQAWFSLGVAYNRAGDVGEAREAFQQALKLRSGHVGARVGLAYTYFVEKRYDEAEREARKAARQSVNSQDYTADSVLGVIRVERYRDTAARVLARAESELAKKPGDAEWHLLRAQALTGLSVGEQTIPPDLTFPRSTTPPETKPDEAALKALREASRARLREAAASLEKYFELKPSDGDPYLRGQLEALRVYARDEDAGVAGRIYAHSQVTKRALVVSKPEPGFTEEARRADLSGIVRLRVVLAVDGKVRHILVLMPLGHGLTERSIEAARGIRFRPAAVNGTPVSQDVILEYNFSFY